MPSTSDKQARTMKAAKHDPAFAKKMGIPPAVASEYVAADAPEKVTEAEATGYAKKSHPTRKRGGGQYQLPNSKKKGD